MEINYKLRKKCGIYSIFNTFNGKKYIGSSKDIYNRLHEHLHNLRAGNSHNKHLQAAWNRYGEENFQFNVLEFCKEEERFNKEQYYIDFMKPEYNFALQVVANLHREISIEQRKQISETLKRRYASGEITAYKQEHNWKKVYIYNIRTFKLVAECKCIADNLRLLYNNSEVHWREWGLIKNTYTISLIKYTNLKDLVNAIYKNVMFINGKYLISDDQGKLSYYRNFVECAKGINSSASTLKKHTDATRENPFVVKKSNIKFFISSNYIDIDVEAVPVEESQELQSSKIGESPAKDNTEVIEEIKESSTPYSIENEPTK